MALLGLLIAVVVAFYQLGMWQLGVSSNDAAREYAQAQAARPTEPLAQVMAPHQPFPDDAAGLAVRTSGHYVAEEQFLVPNRLLEGEPGYWVVTPLLVDGPGEPALLPVLRGFVTEVDLADEPGQDRVTVTGTMAPAESPVATPESGWPAGQRGSIDTADLANDWDAPLFSAFIFLVEEDPVVTAQTLTHVPPPVFGETGVVWRNVGYALQWFVFAGFAVYMYWRFLRQATQGERDEPPPAQPRTEGSEPSASTPPTTIHQGETV